MERRWRAISKIIDLNLAGNSGDDGGSNDGGKKREILSIMPVYMMQITQDAARSGIFSDPTYREGRSFRTEGCSPSPSPEKTSLSPRHTKSVLCRRSLWGSSRNLPKYEIKHPSERVFFSEWIALFVPCFIPFQRCQFYDGLRIHRATKICLSLCCVTRASPSGATTLAFVVICCTRRFMHKNTLCAVCRGLYTRTERKYDICAYIRSERLSMSTMSEMGRLNFSQEGPACVWRLDFKPALACIRLSNIEFSPPQGVQIFFSFFDTANELRRIWCV